MEIKLTAFVDLTSSEVYQILQLRQLVFGLEQQCLYQDMDDRDQNSWHLTIVDSNSLIAYARLIPVGVSYPDYASFGRVVTHPAIRQTGVGKTLLAHIILNMQRLFPGQPIKIGAQLYLQQFYQSVGFHSCGEVYLEDGIEHIHMIQHPL